MNTRRTRRNKSDTELDNKSEEKHDVANSRVTGGESHGRLRGALSSKRTLHDGSYSCTPPKRQHQDIANSYTHAEKREKPRKFI